MTDPATPDPTLAELRDRRFPEAVARFEAGDHAGARDRLTALHREALGAGDRSLAAMCLMGRSSCWRALRHWDPARADLEAARRELLDLGDEVEAARALFGLGNLDYRLARWSDAAAAFQGAQATFAKCGLPVSAARIRFNLANLERRLGRWDEARASYAAARQAFDDGDQEVDAARCAFGAGNVASDIGDLATAWRSYREAWWVMTAHDRPVDAARCVVNTANVERRARRWPEARSAYRHALTTFTEHGERAAAARCQLGLGNLELETGDVDAAAAAYEAAWWVFAELELPSEAARCLVNGALVEQRRQRPERAREGLARAREGFAASGEVIETAWCNLIEARLELDEGRTDVAVDLGLAALTVLDGARHRLVRPTDRRHWSRTWRQLVEMLLRGAVDQGDHRLVVELLESARIHGVPSSAGEEPAADDLLPIPAEPPGRPLVDATRAPPPDHRVAAAAAAAGTHPLAPIRPVAVGGRSALAERRSDDALPPVHLEEVVATLAGPEATWLGLWRSGTQIWWAVLHPGQPPAAGCSEVDLADLDALASALPRPTEAEVDALVSVAPAEERQARLTRHVARRVRGGPLGSAGPADAAADLARRLGRAVVPEPLAEELRARLAAGGEPLRLIVAPGPGLSDLPLAWLAIPGTDGTGDPPRLVEAAELAVVPPAAFVSALDPLAGPVADDETVVAVCDPTGDLPGARIAPLGTTVLHSWSGPHLPTATALLATLRAVVPGAPGALVYQGHHAAPDPDDPLGRGGLVLAGDDGPATLPPGAFLAPPGPGRPNCPRHAFLLACDTLGLPDGAEWLSTTVGLAWAGASAVLATSWPLFDHPGQGLLDLVVAVGDGERLTAALRRHQLLVVASHRRRPRFATAPVTWAGLTVTLARPGPGGP